MLTFHSMRCANLLVLLTPLTVGCSNNIDAIYSKGLDAYTKRDYYAAERDIRKAAQAGHIDGMAMLGVMYLFGRGVKADGEQAEYWLLKSAKAGKVDAQSILGIIYATGQGVPRDKAKAFKWLTAAANEGDEQSAKTLRLLNRDSPVL